MRRVRWSFNTQPPEGGWVGGMPPSQYTGVSTHSRLKAAGYRLAEGDCVYAVSTHSRLKAAGIKRGLF